MRTAAKGALPLAPAEMLEVMVYLTTNPVFSQDARMTLASFDQPATMKVVSDPAGPPDVIAYYWMEENRRPTLLPALIENPLITETMLIEAAVSESRDIIAALVASRRTRKLPDVMAALKENPALTADELEQL